MKFIMPFFLFCLYLADMRLAKLMLRGFGEHEERGNYTVLYDGEGTIEFSLTHNVIHHDGKGMLPVIKVCLCTIRWYSLIDR